MAVDGSSLFPRGKCLEGKVPDDPVILKTRRTFPAAVLGAEEAPGWPTLVIQREQIQEVCRFLRDDPELGFTYLSDLCGVDYWDRDPRFEVVYHLYALSRRLRVRLKVGVPADSCSLPSVVSVWPSANWFEREIYDMYGITFGAHPDLRRILTPDGFEGHPLRKDFPLRGKREQS